MKSENIVPVFSVVATERLQTWQEQAAKATELQDQLLRTRADWDNARKRWQREKEDAVKYAGEALFEKLLPVIDNFELGLQAAQGATDPKSLVQGLQMVMSQFQSFLKEVGVEAIDAVGQPFDPHHHEAMGETETKAQPEGTVVTQTRKGYKLKDRLLRPASVFVAKSPAPQAKVAPAAA
jgi:molecular chaperone GrpE